MKTIGEKTGEGGNTVPSVNVTDVSDLGISEEQLDALEWAKEFMNSYERRKK